MAGLLATLEGSTCMARCTVSGSTEMACVRRCFRELAESHLLARGRPDVAKAVAYVAAPGASHVHGVFANRCDR